MRRLHVFLLVAVAGAPGCAVHNLLKRGDIDLAANRPIAALAKYEEALAREPDLGGKEDFRDRLAAARVGASREHYRRGLDRADSGELDAATTALARAVELDERNADAAEALAFARNLAPPDAPGQAAYRAGTDELARRRQMRAAEQFRSAVAANANHVAARAALHEATEAIARATDLTETARRLLDEGRLDAAIDTLEQSLAIWSDHDAAMGLMGTARARREEARKAYDRAVALNAARDYPGAVAAARAAVRAYPHYGQAKKLLEEATLAAAAELAARGDGLLAGGKLAEAENAYLLALQYVDSLPAARSGLAEIYLRRADADGRQGRWGAALLWAMAATKYDSPAEKDRRSQAAAEAVYARLAVLVQLRVYGSGGLVDADSADLAGRLTARMRALAGDLIRLTDRGAEFTADVSVSPVRAETERTRLEERTQHYTVYRDVLNPEIPKLQALLAAARTEHIRMQRDARRTCPRCGGRGHDCRHCGGRGHFGQYDRWAVSRQADEVERLTRRLRHTPAIVRAAFPAEWPYAVETWERTVTVAAGILIDPGRISAPVRQVASDSDSAVVNANPSVGLAEDGLSLTGEGRLRDDAMARAAGDAAGKIISAVLSARADACAASAETLARRGDEAGALEMRVNAAVLIERVDPSRGRKLLTALRDARQYAPAR